MEVSFEHGRCLDFSGLSNKSRSYASVRFECNSARLALVKLNSPGARVGFMVRIHRPLPIKVRRQSVAARGVLLEPDNVFIVRRDVVVHVQVQILGRIVGPWVEPAVAFHVPVTKRNV